MEQRKVMIGALVALAVVLVVGFLVWRPGKPMERLVLCCPESVQPLFSDLAQRYRVSHDGAPDIQIEAVPDGSCTSDYLGQRFTGGEVDAAVLKVGPDASKVEVSGSADLSGSVSFPEGEQSFAPMAAGGLHAIPLCGNVPVLLCNKALFEKAGLPLPEGRSGVLGACWALKSQDILPFGVEVDESGRYRVSALMDASLLNASYEANRELIVDGQLNDGFYDFQYVAENLKELAPARGEAPVGHDALLQAFKNGSFAMAVGTSDDYRMLLSEGVSCVALPLYGQTDGVRMAWGTTYSFLVPQRSFGAETRDFANWLLSSEAQQLIHDSLKHLPAGGGVEVAQEIRTLYSPSPTAEWCAVPSLLGGLSEQQREACLAAGDAAMDGSLDMEALLEELKR